MPPDPLKRWLTPGSLPTSQVFWWWCVNSSHPHLDWTFQVPDCNCSGPIRLGFYITPGSPNLHSGHRLNPHEYRSLLISALKSDPQMHSYSCFLMSWLETYLICWQDKSRLGHHTGINRRTGQNFFGSNYLSECAVESPVGSASFLKLFFSDTFMILRR